MYSVVTAIGVPVGLNTRWGTIDLTSVKVADLYTNYRRVQVTLTPQGSSVPCYLDLASIQSTYATYQGTFAALLTSLGNASLPTTSSGVLIQNKKAQFVNVLRAGYKVTPVNTNEVPPTTAGLTDCPNARLTRLNPTFDPAYLLNHALVNVNGFYHRASVAQDGNGIIIKDATKGLLRSGQNSVALWSFSNVCSLSVVPITSGMITTTDPANTQIQVPNLDNTKTVFLNLGGYLMPIDGNAFSQIAPNVLKINWNNLPMVERFYESIKFIDLSTIQATFTSGHSQNQITVSDLTSVAAIQAWLSLSQSFLVVFDTPNLYIQRQYVARTGVPNSYFTQLNPRSPLIMKYGKHAIYWPVKEGIRHRLYLYDNRVDDLALRTIADAQAPANTTDAKAVMLSRVVTPAYLMEVGTDI